MRQKYLNSMKTIIILLLGVIFLFSILGTFNLLPDVEGLDNAPKCDTKLHDITDDSIDAASYTDDLWNNDNYVLKTTIVPPQTTPCPTNINSTDSTNATQTVTESTSSSSSSSNVNDSYTLDPTNTPSTPATPAIPAPSAIPATNTNTNTNPVASSENTGTLSPSDYTTNANAQPDKKADSCPPCPACERCPEPSFDCKKVPNYRSKSIGQYLPMPILTDFSKF